jgi:tetratricopeptide (TPR) repeat protein
MRKVLATNERLHGRNNANTMRQYMRLASLLQAQSKPKEGLEQLGIASSIAEQTAGRDSTSYIAVQNNIAGALRELGRVDEAIVILREMLPHVRKLWPGDAMARLQLERNVGLTMSNRGLVDEARPLLASAYETSRRLSGEEHRDTTRLMLDLASLDTRGGKPDDAAAWLAKADKQMPANDGRMTIQRHAIGGELAMLNQDYGVAFGEFAKAEEANRQLYGDKDARYWLARMNRITVLTARNQGNDMADARTLAAEIHEKLAPTLDPAAGAIVKLKRLMQQ